MSITTENLINILTENIDKIQDIRNFINDKKQKKEKKIDILCYNCKKRITRKIGNFDICRQCFNFMRMKYYEEKANIKREKISRIKKLHEIEHYKSNGEKIKLFIKDTNKICKICNEDKHFTDYYLLRDTHNISSPENYYISTYCKICSSKKQIKQSKYVNGFIEKDINK